jgi:hypothetical protein
MSGSVGKFARDGRKGDKSQAEGERQARVHTDEWEVVMVRFGSVWFFASFA